MTLFAVTVLGGVVNVTAVPRWPWNGKVDITCKVLDVTAAPGGALYCSVHLKGYDKIKNTEIEIKTLSPDGVSFQTYADGTVSDLVGTTHHLVWDAAQDCPTLNSSAFSVSATVRVTNKPLPYQVVDLTTGESRFSDTPPDLSDDTCRTTELWLRWVPAGTFMMGSPEDELGRSSSETQHEVTLTSGYYIGVFEVTQKQWELVMGNTPSLDKGDTRPVERVSYDDIRGSTLGAGWPSGGHAVDADSFLGKLRAKTGGLEFDLPTEAQWEYACRAGTTTALNSGKNLTSTGECPNMSEVGRYWYNRSDGKGGYTEEHTKVGSYLPNAWGLYDMHGNVGEWCLDWYGDYPKGTVSDPTGAPRSSYHVARGGEWNYDARNCRSAHREDSYPSYRNYGSGFRIVCCPPD